MGVDITSTGCLLNASDASEAVVDDLASRLGVNALFVRGAMSLPRLHARPPASSSDGAAPGLRLSDDDSALRAALDAARRAGADPYLVLPNPLAGRAEWTDLLATDNGGRPAHRIDASAPTLCPNQPKLLKWLVAAAAEAVRTYKPAGVLLEDFSLGAAGSVDSLFLCWCDRCQARTGELGYDADRVRIGLQGARSKLEQGGTRIAHLNGIGLPQFIEAVGYDTGLLDWINFRADSVSACLYEVRQAIAGVDRGVRVGILGRSPTAALLAGQRRADVLRDTTLADFYVPVVCGPASGALDLLAAHAERIRATGDGLGDTEAVALAAELNGYDGVPMPATTAELVKSPSAVLLATSAERELRLVLGASGSILSSSAGEVPVWPAIDVSGVPAAVVAATAERIREADVEGLVTLGVPQ